MPTIFKPKQNIKCSEEYVNLITTPQKLMEKYYINISSNSVTVSLIYQILSDISGESGYDITDYEQDNYA